MTNLLDGLPPDVTAGRMGSYVITIKRTSNGYILRANPKFRQGGRSLAAFYGDQTGLITYNRTGELAGPYDERMQPHVDQPKDRNTTTHHSKANTSKPGDTTQA